MAVSFNSNVGAQRALRQLSAVSQGLAGTRARLASGARINAASDDAAGLAVADRLRVSSRLYTQSLRNLSDGISILGIADSALEQQSGIIMRLKELAQQASNGTFSASQRSTLNQEYRSLIEEFGRLAESVQFNGLDLLRGARGNSPLFDFQAGITGGTGSSISFAGIDSSSLSGSMNLTFDIADSNGNAGADGVIDSGDLNFFAANAGSKLSYEQMMAMSGNRPIIIKARDDEGDERDLYITMNAFDGFGGIGILQIYAKQKDADSYVALYGPAPIHRNPDTNQIDLSGSAPLLGNIAEFSTTDIDLSGIRVFAETTFDGTPADPTAAPTLLEQTGLETSARALFALEILENRLSEINSYRGQLGATESRLMSALTLSTVSAENSKAAESRIRDADIAMESAQAVRLQILQQTAAQVLSTVSRQPNLGLELL